MHPRSLLRPLAPGALSRLSSALWLLLNVVWVALTLLGSVNLVISQFRDPDVDSLDKVMSLWVPVFAVLIGIPLFALLSFAPFVGVEMGLKRLRRLFPEVSWMWRYTKSDWDRENNALVQRGDPQPCPMCRRTGFYSPRYAEDRLPSPKYRACKFCGFWQNVQMAPHDIIRYECHVADWKEPHEDWTCPKCQKRYTPDYSVRWPADNRHHSWWRVPQRESQAFYLDYWRKLGHDSSPFGIV